MIPQKLLFNTPLIYEKYNTNEKPHILGDRNVRFIAYKTVTYSIIFENEYQSKFWDIFSTFIKLIIRSKNHYVPWVLCAFNNHRKIVVTF